MPPDPIPVLDCHHHVGPRSRLSGGESAVGYEDDARQRTALLDRFDIGRAVLLASHSMSQGAHGGLQDVNDVVAEMCRRYPQRFPAGLGTVDPVLGPDGIREVERCARDLGMKGIVWHGRFQGVWADAQSLDGYIQATVDLGLVVGIHVIAESKMESLWRLFRLAERYPEARIIAYDGFSSFDQSEWLCHEGGRFPNIWFDTACLLPIGRPIERFVERFGPDRLLFGSSFSTFPPMYVYPSGLFEVLYSAIDDAAKHRILHANAEELLDLPSLDGGPS